MFFLSKNDDCTAEKLLKAFSGDVNKPVLLRNKCVSCIVMQEASDAHSKTADSDTVSTYQVSSVQLVTDKKLEAFNNRSKQCHLIGRNSVTVCSFAMCIASLLHYYTCKTL